MSQELDQLQQQYQEHMTQTQIHMAERLKQQVTFIYIFVNFGMPSYTAEILHLYVAKLKCSGSTSIIESS